MTMIIIVVGPPCAGKSTYVSEQWQSGDVIVDADAIAHALGADTRHARDGVHRSLMFGARQLVINRILSGIDAVSYIIHTNPSQNLVDRYIDAGAEFVVIDPGKDVCLARAKDDDRPDGTDDVIEQWYESPPNLTHSGQDKSVVWLVQ